MPLNFQKINAVLNRLFRQTPPQGSTPAVGFNNLKGSKKEALAVQVLSDDYGALAPLSAAQARIAVGYMKEKVFKNGKMVLAEGENTSVDYMLIVLNGEVTVESIMVGQSEPMMLTVLGAGCILGELSLFDKGPRSTTCTAISDLTCALLTGESFKELLQAHPAVGVKLLLLISIRMAERLRDNTQKLKFAAQLNKTLMKELLDNAV